MSDTQHFCSGVCDELRDLCRQFAGRNLTEQQFIAAVLLLEEGRICNNGLILIGSNTSDDWTHFAIRSRKDRSLCFGFEFNPDSGEFREVGEG